MKIISRWAIGVIAIVITVYILKALKMPIEWNSDWGMIIFVPVLAIVNAVLGNLIRLLALPITCLTFGLFGFVINALVFWMAGSATGAENMGFKAALVGSILYTVISAPLSSLIKEK